MSTCSFSELPTEPPHANSTSNAKASHTRSRSHTSESSSTTSSNISLPTPPDGGWGWVVVLASFVVHMIADGCAFSFGVLYVELLEYFGESKSKTAWAGSVAVSIPLITGPIASALTTRYGCRRTTIVGGLIASFGFVTSAFAPNIEVLCITFGLIAGFGLSMVYVPAVIIVAFYFHKKRAFATGLAVAGSGIGTFLFAPLTEWLIEMYTWKGALIVIGGIMLNIVACGAVFRPLEATLGRKKKPMLDQEETSITEALKSFEDTTSSGDHLHDIGTHSLIQLPTYINSDRVTSLRPDLIKDADNHLKNIHMQIQHNKLMNEDKDSGHAVSSSSDRTSSTSATHSTDCEVAGLITKDDSSLMITTDTTLAIRSVGAVWPRQKIPKNRISDQFLPMYRKDIFYRGSLLRTFDSERGLNTSNLDIEPSKSASCPNILLPYQQDMQDFDDSHCCESKAKLCNSKCSVLGILQLSSKARRVLREMLDVSLLRNAVFVYFCLSSMLLYMWYDVPYVYIPDKASNTLGISHDRSSFLISIIGIASMVGQIVVGYVGDLPQVNALLLYNVLTSIAGIGTILAAVLHSYALLATYCAAFGFFISGNYALTTIILVDLLGMEKLTNAYGLVMLSEGVANLIGPSLAGYLADLTGSYDLAFYVAGTGILISGVMLVLIPPIKRCQYGADDELDQSESPIQISTPTLSKNDRKLEVV